MNLYFNDNYGNYRFLGWVEDREEATKSIQKFLDDHNFVSYYTRTWKDKKGREWFDVGSHCEFFVLTEDRIDAE